MLKHRIETTGAPAARPVLSQGIRKGPYLQVSGQGPADPVSGEYVAQGDVGAQTTRTLRNVLAVVEAGGGTFEDVVMLRVYLRTQADFAAMNEAYAAFLAEHVPSGVLPARTTVGAELPDPAMLVEIDALAIVAD
jgi:reactive intermediate/imine deaminase